MNSFKISQLQCIKSEKFVPHITPVCSHLYIVLPLKPGKNIGVWHLQKLQDEPVILSGHHTSVTATALSHHHNGRLLCSCSDDNIILWDLFQNEGKPERGRVLLSSLGNVCHCTFNYNDSKVALCHNRQLVIIDLKNLQKVVTLEEHSGYLVSCEFAWEDKIFVVSEDRVCKVWNLQTESVIGQIHLSQAVPSCLSVCLLNRYVAIGMTNGSVIIYDSHLQQFSHLHVWKLVREARSDDQLYSNFQTESMKVGDSFGESSFSVFTMHFLHKGNIGIMPNEVLSETGNSAERLFPDPSFLIIITNVCAVIMNVNTRVITMFLDFQGEEQLPVTSEMLQSNRTIGTIQSAAISNEPQSCQISLLLLPLFESKIVIMKLNMFNSQTEMDICSSMEAFHFQEKNYEQMEKNILSFLTIPSSDEKSLLMPNISSKTSAEASKIQKKGSSAKPLHFNHPVTFHTKIKSSGYNAAPRRVMFQPCINKKKVQGMQLPKKPSSTSSKWITTLEQQNVWSAEKPKLISEFHISSPPSLTALHLKGDGKHIACGLQDGTVEMLEVSNLKRMYTLMCHNGPVTSIHHSHSGELLLTRGSDGTAKVWLLQKRRMDPLLTVNPSLKPFIKNSKQAAFHDINLAKFYYMDNFLLVTFGGSLHMYSYTLDSTKSDIKRYTNCSSCKLVTSVSLDAKYVTAIGAINQFYSHLTICADSAKSLNIIDMRKGQCVRHVTNSHGRPVHCISLNEGSPYVTLPASLHDVFLTVSLGDGIKVWDLRCNRSVLCYTQYANRSIACQSSFSTCGRYIAAGSEDRNVYLYDLRATSCLHKLSGHSDVTLQVTFNPIQPQVLVATLDSSLYLYKNFTLKD